jgi:SAM-dependent methyltransferase
MTEAGNTPVASQGVPASAVMLQMLAGFQVSQALYAVAKLGVATRLASGPKTVSDLAAEVGADADALTRIIRFLATLGVFRTDGDLVEATELGALLAEGPASAGDMAIFWMETHYEPFGQLTESVRLGQATRPQYYDKPFFEWIADDPERVEITNRAMAAITNTLRDGMFDGYRLPEGAVVADIGGSDGSMLVRFLADDPDRHGIVFDQPKVVTSAEDIIADHQLTDRIRTVGGDFFESVPEADVYILSHILHDWDDESSRRILRNIASAAKPGARLVIVEAVIPPGDEPHPAKVLDITMLAILTGRERTAPEFTSLLDSAGFTLDRIVQTPTMYCFTEATLR